MRMYEYDENLYVDNEPDEDEYVYWSRLRRHKEHQFNTLLQTRVGVSRLGPSKEVMEMFGDRYLGPYNPSVPDNLMQIEELTLMTKKSRFLTHIENRPVWVQVLGAKLVQALTAKDITKAEKYLNQLKKLDGMGTPVNQQYIKTMQIRIMQLKKTTKSSKMKTLIEETLGMTLKGLDLKTLRAANDVLVRVPLSTNELELFQCLALEYEREGNYSEACRLLDWVTLSLNRLEHDFTTTQLMPKMYITLAVCYIKSRDFERAMGICHEGIKFSSVRLQGRYAAELLFLQKKAEDKSDEVNFSADYVPFYGYDYDRLPKAETFGDLVHALRVKCLKSPLELSSGICSVNTLTAIESGEEEGNPLILAALLEKLGVNMHLFGAPLLSGKDFINEAMKDKVREMIKQREYDEAEKFLNLLALEDSFKEGINLQFIESAKATALDDKLPKHKQLTMAIRNLEATCPFYNESTIEHLMLTVQEANLINQIGIAYGSCGDLSHAIAIFEKFYNNLINRHEDDAVRTETLISVMFNYIKYLGLASLHEEAITLIEEAKILAKRTGFIFIDKS